MLVALGKSKLNGHAGQDELQLLDTQLQGVGMFTIGRQGHRQFGDQIGAVNCEGVGMPDPSLLLTVNSDKP